jgi:phosphatidate cytidylyltransferase
MLGWRLFLSSILIPSLFGLFYFDHQIGEAAPILFVFCLLLALRSVWELVELLRDRFSEIHFSLPALCSLGIIAAAWVPHWTILGNSFAMVSSEFTMIAFVISVLLLFFTTAIRYREPGKNLETLAAEILIVSYIGLLLSMTAQLKWVAGSQAGYLAIGSLIVAAKCGDSCAYFLGRLWGKKKMAPRLSPGKTWMGACGALSGSGLGGWAWLQFATPMFEASWEPCAWYWSALYGMIIGVTGLIGDLCESLIKRDTGKKDSAPLMPGFGGLLDLLDSILFAGPVAYVLWLVLPLNTWL